MAFSFSLKRQVHVLTCCLMKMILSNSQKLQKIQNNTCFTSTMVPGPVEVLFFQTSVSLTRTCMKKPPSSCIIYISKYRNSDTNNFSLALSIYTQPCIKTCVEFRLFKAFVRFRKQNTSIRPIDTVAINTSFVALSFEPRCEKTGFLHMRKQRRRSAAQ